MLLNVVRVYHVVKVIHHVYEIFCGSEFTVYSLGGSGIFDQYVSCRAQFVDHVTLILVAAIWSIFFLFNAFYLNGASFNLLSFLLRI